MSPNKEFKAFIPLLVLLYVAAIVLTGVRTYVLHAYPIYYSTDDMPNEIQQITAVHYWRK